MNKIAESSNHTEPAGAHQGRATPTPGSVSRAALFPLAQVVLLAALAFVLAGWAQNRAAPPRCDVGVEADIGCARGFENRENDERGTFRWSDSAAQVLLPGIGYGAPAAVQIRLAAPRPPDSPPAQVRLLIAGQTLPVPADGAVRRYHVLLPATFANAETAHIGILSDTFKPGSTSRFLGAQVYEASAALPGPRWPALVPTLALLAVALSLADGQRWRGVLAGVAAMAVCAGLWATLPSRTLPYLAGLALISGAARLLLCGRQSLTLLLQPPVMLALLLNAALDSLLLAGFVPRLWVALPLLAMAALTVWAIWQTRKHSGTLGSLLAVALVARLLGFAVRLLLGHGASDPDTPLFYSYGRAALELGVPNVEYPSGALIPWALMALPASRELFNLLLPLLNLVCDLASVAALWWIGERVEPDQQPPVALPLFYALSPLLLPFWHGKYDPLPAALLALGLAALASNRPFWAGVALGFGGTVKWVPWLAGPPLLRPSRNAGWLVLGGVVAVAAASVPFALHDFAGFLSPYLLQGGRPIVGESIWFLLALPLDPGVLGQLSAPWSGVDDPPFGNTVTMAVQALVLLALWLPPLIRRVSPGRALALAALAPTLFLLLNRVFSPQYLLPISVGVLAAAIARRAPPFPVCVALALMQWANLLIWPNTSRSWVAASALLFGIALTLCAWLALYQPREPRP